MSESLNPLKSKLNTEMEATIEHLEKELTKVRAGKANPSMLNGIMVEYYGTPTPLSQVSSISVPDARSLSIKPWEKPLLQEIEKAIFAANLGFTPQNDGENIRINIPALTEERRKELVKQIKNEGEQAKISLRSARKNANDAIKVLGKDSLSEDQVKDAEAEVQKMINGCGEKVDRIVKAKEDEVMTI